MIYVRQHVKMIKILAQWKGARVAAAGLCYVKNQRSPLPNLP